MSNAITSIASTLAKPAKNARAINPAVPTDKIYLDANGVKLAKDAYLADKTAGNKWVKFADYARSQGVTSTMVIKGGEAREWIQQNIVIPFGLSPEQRAAIMAPKAALKGWTEEQKTFRRVNCQQAVGSLTNKIAGHLMTEAEKKAAEGSKESKEAKTSEADTDTKKAAPLADTLKKELTAMIVRIQKAEDTEGFDAGKLCKALTMAIALIR